MGKVGGVLFGKPAKQKSSSTNESGNYAYPSIMSAYGPAMGYTSSAGNMMGSLLGLDNSMVSTGQGSAPAPVPAEAPATHGHGELFQKKQGTAPTTPQAPTPIGPTYTGTGQTDALSNWANSGGMKFMMDQGVNAIESSQAAKNMLSSGATLKGLEKFGTNLGSTYLNQYMDNLYKQAQLGIQAGGLVTGAGGWSKGTGTSSGTGGKQGLVQTGAAAATQAAAGGA